METWTSFMGLSNFTATPESASLLHNSWKWWEWLLLLLAIVGIVGNGIVIYILFRPCRKGQSTDTLIAALAVADFLSSFFITLRLLDQELPTDPVAADLYCKVIKSSLPMWISIYASIYTLTSISVERCLAVRYPIIFMRLLTARRTRIMCVLIWVVSIILKVPPHFAIWHYVEADRNCKREFSNGKVEKFYGVLTFLVQFFIPVIVMITAHVMTIRNLRWHRRRSAVSRRGFHSPDRRELRLLLARRRVIQMLFVVVVTFIICWTPNQVEFFILNIGIVEHHVMQTDYHQFFVALAFANSCINPFIYSVRNVKFRRELKQIICRTPSARGKLQNVFGDEYNIQKHHEIDTAEEMHPV